MILEFLVILMTQHLPEQKSFYQEMLNIDLLFENETAVGLGQGDRLFILLKKDTAEESHHLAEQKGPQIITFKCDGNLDEYRAKIAAAGFTIRSTLQLPEHHAQYLFVEDYDGNEVCLDFPFHPQ